MNYRAGRRKQILSIEVMGVVMVVVMDRIGDESVVKTALV